MDLSEGTIYQCTVGECSTRWSWCRDKGHAVKLGSSSCWRTLLDQDFLSYLLKQGQIRKV